MNLYTKFCLALVLAVSLLQVACIPGMSSKSLTMDDHARYEAWQKPPITDQPVVEADVAPYINDSASEPELSNELLVQLLQDKIKYVFVIFNENHSFDNEYGTFPGVNGLYSDGRSLVPPRKRPALPKPTRTMQPFDRH